MTAAAALPPLSASFRSLFASCFFEGQRRQTRHLKISTRFAPPDGSNWQISLPERLLGLSGLGLFAFDFFATSMPGDLLFVDEHHPMVAHGRVAAPGEDGGIMKLRAQFPDTPEFHASSIAGCDDTLIHGVCSIAVTHTGALFYYRCPNNAMPGAAVWVLVKSAIADPATLLPSIPANLAALAPPRADFGSYDALVAVFDANRPTGQAARLNEFRISLIALLSMEFPDQVAMKDMVLGFLHANGYAVQETPQGELSQLVALVGDAPGLTMTFDAAGRMHNVKMTLSADAYVDDSYDL